RHEAKTVIRGDGNFVAIDVYASLSNNLTRIEIDQKRGVIGLIGHEQEAACGRSGGIVRGVRGQNKARRNQKEQRENIISHRVLAKKTAESPQYSTGKLMGDSSLARIPAQHEREQSSEAAMGNNNRP